LGAGAPARGARAQRPTSRRSSRRPPPPPAADRRPGRRPGTPPSSNTTVVPAAVTTRAREESSAEESLMTECVAPRRSTCRAVAFAAKRPLFKWSPSDAETPASLRAKFVCAGDVARVCLRAAEPAPERRRLDLPHAQPAPPSRPPSPPRAAGEAGGPCCRHAKPSGSKQLGGRTAVAADPPGARRAPTAAWHRRCSAWTRGRAK